MCGTACRVDGLWVGRLPLSARPTLPPPLFRCACRLCACCFLGYLFLLGLSGAAATFMSMQSRTFPSIYSDERSYPYGNPSPGFSSLHSPQHVPAGSNSPFRSSSSSPHPQSSAVNYSPASSGSSFRPWNQFAPLSDPELLRHPEGLNALAWLAESASDRLWAAIRRYGSWARFVSASPADRAMLGRWAAAELVPTAPPRLDVPLPVFTYASEWYPPALRGVPLPPPLLWGQGRPPRDWRHPVPRRIGVVGRPSRTGRAAALSAVHAASTLGVSVAVVADGAVGTCAGWEALRMGVPLVVVVPSGPRSFYEMSLRRAAVEAGGAVVFCGSSHTPHRSRLFWEAERAVVGLSSVVVCSDPGSPIDAMRSIVQDLAAASGRMLVSPIPEDVDAAPSTELGLRALSDTRFVADPLRAPRAVPVSSPSEMYLVLADATSQFATAKSPAEIAASVA